MENENGCGISFFGTDSATHTFLFAFGTENEKGAMRKRYGATHSFLSQSVDITSDKRSGAFLAHVTQNGEYVIFLLSFISKKGCFASKKTEVSVLERGVRVSQPSEGAVML